LKDSNGDNRLSLGGRLSILAGGRAIKALASTWRYRIIDGDYIDGLRREGTPALFALWHGEMLPLLWHHRDEDIAVVVSEHKDGEIIARILEWLGYSLIRGSTSRGAARALLGLVRTLRSGHDAAITPDGPRGPRHKFAPGAVIAANRAGTPILPIVAHVDRFWQLSSWDGFVIPKPFARITVAYGPPTLVTAETVREAAEEGPRIERIMEETRRKACSS
jgi:lysophospholipid acyltransferase (LPLAT)-like uncharacterized protein